VTESRLDTLGMFDALVRTPELIVSSVDAAQDLEGLPPLGSIHNVLVLGVGDSGAAGDLVTVTAGPFMPVPVVVVKNYLPPSYVNENTLVFAVSYSGNATETLEASTAAAEAGAPVVAITSGGVLADRAAIWGAATVLVDDTIPSPRAAFSSLAVTMLIVLEDLGLFPGATQWVIHAIEQLRRRRNEIAGQDSFVDDIADRLLGTAPLIQGGGGIGGVAADRWKTQINVNAKMPAFSSMLPNLGHNEIQGWATKGDRTRELLTAVQLRHEHEHPLVGRGFEVVNAMIEGVVAGSIEVRAAGDGPVAQMLDLMMVGDAVSLSLAHRLGVDPGPAPAIDELEARLRQ